LHETSLDCILPSADVAIVRPLEPWNPARQVSTPVFIPPALPDGPRVWFDDDTTMEKYSQFRDRATGIAPFLPVTTPLAGLSILVHGFLFFCRLPLFLTYAVGYFLVFQHLPLPGVARKVALWGMMAIPGIWWIDLQLDGVKRGTLADQPRERFPHPGSVIAANFTSPIDAVYLAAIFDPVFTVSYPGTRGLQRVGLLQAVMMALAPVKTGPPANAKLVDIKDLLREYPGRVIAVFPECGTSNGKAILPFSPSVLQTPPDVHVFPVSIRYSPSDVTTPIPGRWITFLWTLLSQPTICIRVRVAEGQVNTAAAQTNGASSSVDEASELRARGGASDSAVSSEEQRVLDRIGEALARLSRVKRVGLTMKDKSAFVTAFQGKKA
jgi:1-acyl-sn-glycerol-3-phosphate acyltransferase